MNRPLLAFAGLMSAGATAVGVYVAAPGGGEEEVAQQVATPTPEATSASPSPEPATPPATTATPAPSGAVIPAGWLQYPDPVLGFSLRYPPDLVLKDLSSEAGRILDFRAAKDGSRAFSVEIYTNTQRVTLRDWALTETACLPETIEETVVAGAPAVLCTEQATETPNSLVVLDYSSRIYEIGSLLPPAEFDTVLASLRL